jgi:hypothetical protein
MEQMKTTASAKKSSIWLWLVLVVTLGLTGWMMLNHDADSETDGIALAVPEKHRVKQSVLSQPKARLMQTSAIDWSSVKNRVDITVTPDDLFAVHSWQVAERRVTEKVRPLPIPEPTAPPAPFAYAGKLEDGPEGTVVFLSGNNKVYSVARGKEIDAFWRLDREDSNNLYLTYLPLNLPQTLSKNQHTLAPALNAGSSQRFNSSQGFNRSNADE